MNQFFETLQMIGWAVIVNIAMEAYHARRAQEQMGDYDSGME